MANLGALITFFRTDQPEVVLGLNANCWGCAITRMLMTNVGTPFGNTIFIWLGNIQYVDEDAIGIYCSCCVLSHPDIACMVPTCNERIWILIINDLFLKFIK